MLLSEGSKLLNFNGGGGSLRKKTSNVVQPYLDQHCGTEKDRLISCILGRIEKFELQLSFKHNSFHEN